jgi:putative transcriptional regulator
MAIEWRLAALMAQQGMNYKKLGEATGMHPNTISKLKHNPPTRLEMVTLIRLCQALQCQPGELLVYVPEAISETAEKHSTENC